MARTSDKVLDLAAFCIASVLLLRTGFNRRVVQVRDCADDADRDRTDRDN
jgi:hypothetical protein